MGTTTLSVSANGTTLRMVVVDSVAWGTLTFDENKIVTLRVANGGASDRYLKAIIERPGTGAANQGVELLANPATSTTSIANDTLTVDFVLTGDSFGYPEYNTIYSGEAVEVVTCEANVVTSGSAFSGSVAAATAVTNNSTATKPNPYAWVVSETHNTRQTGTFDVWVDVLSKHRVSNVAVTLTDGTNSQTLNATSRQTVFTRATQNINGVYTPVTRGLDVYKVTFNASDFLAATVGTLNVTVTDAIGTAWSTTSDQRVSNRKIFLDKNSLVPTQNVYVNCHSTVMITGETGGTIAVGDRIKGATSNALGVVTGRSGNTLTYVWFSTLTIASGETINVVNSAQTNSGVSATTTSAGTRVISSGAGAINDSAQPYDSIARALHAVRTANNAAGRTANYDGAVVNLQTSVGAANYTSVFGFTAPAAGRMWVKIQNDPSPPNGYTPKYLGGPTFRTEHLLWHSAGIEVDIAFTSTTQVFSFGSGDNAQIKMTDTKFTTFNSSTTCQNAYFMEGRRISCADGGYALTKGIKTTDLGHIVVDCIWLSETTTERDYLLLQSTHGFAYEANVFTKRFQGTAAGNHSDIIQTVDGQKPHLFHNFIAAEVGYQFLFIGGASGSACEGLGILNGIVELANDGDMGSSPLAVDQPVNGPLVFTNLVVIDSRDSGSTFRGATFNNEAKANLRISNCLMGAITIDANTTPNIRVAAHKVHMLGTTVTGIRPSSSSSGPGYRLTDVTTTYSYPSTSNWASGTPYRRTYNVLTADNVDGLVTDVYGAFIAYDPGSLPEANLLMLGVG